MARYYPVSPLFWSDEKVVGWDEPTTLLALYLLTCEHRNLEGLYRLPYAYIQADLEWSADEVRERMGELIVCGFIDYDEAARVVLLPKALKYHTPKSERHVQGAINALQEVPDTVLWDRFVAAAGEFAPALYARLEPAESNPMESLSEGFISEGIARE